MSELAPEVDPAADEEVAAALAGDFDAAREASAATAVDAPRIAKQRRRRRNRRPVKRAVIVTHRWLSLVLGIVLLVITTSGAAVVYAPEWTTWTNSEVFDVHASDHPVSMSEAMATVEAAHPGFRAGSVNVYDGLYEVYAADDDKYPGFYGVDPGTGRITGHADPNSGVMAFMVQVHECFFTCEDYPGYVSWLAEPVPTLGMDWLTDVTWSGLVLGVFGLLLIFLAVSGIWLWWPGIKRMSHGFRVRTGKGRYARDYDLHQVIGMVAIPFLLVWGITGASFEFHWVKTAWYAVTGGQQDDYVDTDFASKAVKDKTTPDIGLDAAITAARTQAGSATLVYASLPTADDPTGYYAFWFAKGFDQYRHGAYPGEFGVDVDRHDAGRVHSTDYGHAPTFSNRLMDQLAAPMLHYGQSFNGWWRIFWFVFGLTPLALAVTGVSTWLAKRKVKKNRRRRAAERAGSAADPHEFPAVTVAGSAADAPAAAP